MKPQKLWMMQGPKGQIAPFYGCAFTKKELLYRVEQDKRLPTLGCKPVRVTVTSDLRTDRQGSAADEAAVTP